MIQKNSLNKRQKDAMAYVDSLADTYSKLCVVRVDLAFKKPYSDEIGFDEANENLDHLFNNKRTKPKIFKDCVGYIIKAEYTEDKGMHYHTTFFLDGQTRCKDKHIGDLIGNYWSNEITGGKGTYHNCNTNQEDYKQNGVGMIDYFDTQKREVLKNEVVSYLCKEDEKQDIEPIKTNKNSRAFRRGIMPKKKSEAGRPRER